MSELLGDARLQWAVWAVLLGVAAAMTAFAAHGTFLPGDVTLARNVQSLHDLRVFGPLSEGLYRFGMSPVWPVVTVGVAGVLVWQHRYVAASFMMLTAVVRGFNLVLKDIVERPRPNAAYVSYVEGAQGYSFPSGHVFGTVLLVGFIAYVFIERETNASRRWLIAASAGAVIFLMGVQRVYSGAHWPTDALAGWLWGGLVLFVVIQAYRAVSRRMGA